ncbi:hypothetical protein [Almyronema epifaneia]|uniref:Uncharacterized protein n=1 Tax=Almyronema epifaneia S1 TaxID=2991925 RepID=A0ABW6IFC6_9CYAN
MKRVLLGGLSTLLVLAPTSLVQAQSSPSFENLPSAQAQTSDQLSAVLPAQETLYLEDDAVREYSLRLESAAIINGVNVPAGSVIRGEFRPVEGGLQYVATGVEANNRFYSINAESDTLHDVKDPREASLGSILTDAAIGAAGGFVLSEILGDVDLLEVVGGAAAGVIVGNTTAQRVVVVKPDQPILLQTLSR